MAAVYGKPHRAERRGRQDLLSRPRSRPRNYTTDPHFVQPPMTSCQEQEQEQGQDEEEIRKRESEIVVAFSRTLGHVM